MPCLALTSLKNKNLAFVLFLQKTSIIRLSLTFDNFFILAFMLHWDRQKLSRASCTHVYLT